MNSTASELYVIATPIGHLADISTRAIQTLQSCDWLLCEDTRQTAKLLSLLGLQITAQLVSYHDHNEKAQAGFILEKMLSGSIKVGLVSDAGTPCLNDPGYRIVNLARQNGIPVVPIPGASSLSTLLSASGLSCARFQFVGYLPRTEHALKKEWEFWISNPMSYVFLESPHRIQKTITSMRGRIADWNMCLGRELTKINEEFYFGRIDSIEIEILKTKGEYIGIVAPDSTRSKSNESKDDVSSQIRDLLIKGLSVSDICDVLTHSNFSKKEIYRLALEHQDRLKRGTP